MKPLNRMTASTMALIVAGGVAFAETQSTGEKIGEAAENAYEETKEAVKTGASKAGDALNSAMDKAETGVKKAAETVQAKATEVDFNNPDHLIRTRDITGGEVYTLTPEEREAGWHGDTEYLTIGENWKDVGEIEDIILSPTGQMIGVVAEVGGFLDIGDKHVVLKAGDMRLVPTDDNDYAIVTAMSEEQLMQLEDVDEGFWQ